jgi:hypothetical protein
MPFMPIEKLDNLMGGAMQEKFRVALAEVLANVRDPNTKATAKRGITLTVIIAPNANRDTAQMEVSVKTKTAPSVPAETTIYLDYNDDGLVTATEKLDQIPGQINMDGTETPLPNVVTFESKK